MSRVLTQPLEGWSCHLLKWRADLEVGIIFTLLHLRCQLDSSDIVGLTLAYVCVCVCVCVWESSSFKRYWKPWNWMRSRREWLDKRSEGWGTSLVVQWLRIHLSAQGTWGRPLDGNCISPCHRATKRMCYNYWARVLSSPSSATAEAPLHYHKDPVQPK